MGEPTASSLGIKIQKAVDLIAQLEGAVVALSAGVDSSLVALLAHRALGDQAVAVTGVSESLPAEELEVAKQTARDIGIRHLTVRTNELDNPDYSSNPKDRCYYCKETLYGELKTIAKRLGIQSILDGTQVDDLGDDRPGLRAAREAGVVSPLLLSSFSKLEVREAAKTLGLTVWDKPAMPCLSSRVAHGEDITNEKLRMIEQAELFIRNMTGVRELRVRYIGSAARVEVSPDERRIFFDERIMDRVDAELRRLGFTNVAIDLRGYSRKQKLPETESIVLPLADASR